jgi:hypothetical protein
MANKEFGVQGGSNQWSKTKQSEETRAFTVVPFHRFDGNEGDWQQDKSIWPLHFTSGEGFRGWLIL